MFDIGFSEIVVIAVVALIVIGPERLPKAARTLGHLFGRLQRYVNEVKADINREMEIDELRKLQQQVQTAARDLETSISTAAREVETGVRAVESDLNAAASGAKPEPPGADAMQPPAATQEGAGAAPASGSAPAEAEPPRQASLPGFERG
jgi:sec-independent protein translocase protein TatB